MRSDPVKRKLPPGMKFGKYRSWRKANDRRGMLIMKKYQGGGLTSDEEKEYVLLQAMAEKIVNYMSRPTMEFMKKRLASTNRLIRKIRARLGRVSAQK